MPSLAGSTAYGPSSSSMSLLYNSGGPPGKMASRLTMNQEIAGSTLAVVISTLYVAFSAAIFIIIASCHSRRRRADYLRLMSQIYPFRFSGILISDTRTCTRSSHDCCLASPPRLPTRFSLPSVRPAEFNNRDEERV